MPSQLSSVIAVLFICATAVNGAFDSSKIRLVGGNDPSEGRVEIFFNGEWGTVCNDKVSSVDATVICRMGGFSVGEKTDKFGPGDNSLTIHLDGLECTGPEKDVLDCQRNLAVDCTHNEDIGVKCTGGDGSGTTKAPAAPPTTTKTPIEILPDNCAKNLKPDNVRLRGPRGQEGIGIVEVKNTDGEWGTMCDDLLNVKTAQVICRMLCFNPALALPGAPASGITGNDLQVPIRLDNVQCVGTETSIFNCDHSSWGNHNCENTEYAMVTCKPYPSENRKAPEPILKCSSNMMTVSFSKARDSNLDTGQIKVYDKGDLSTVTCSAETTESTEYVTITIPYGECNTNLTSNETHLIFSNIILYDSAIVKDNIIRVPAYLIHVSCELPRDNIIDDNFIPQSLTVTKSAEGVFVVDMKFYRDSLFTQPVKPPIFLPLGDFLYVDIILTNAVSNLKVVVRNCIATPSPNAADVTNHALFRNSCQSDETVGFFPFSRTDFRFAFQTFKFQFHQDVYLHCDTYVCKVFEERGICDRSCNKTGTTRRKRSAESSNAHHIQINSGPIHLYNPQHFSDKVVIETISNGSHVTKAFLKNTTPVPATTSSTPRKMTTTQGDMYASSTGQSHFSVKKISKAISTTGFPSVVDEKTNSHTEDLSKLGKDQEKLLDNIQGDGDSIMFIRDGTESSANCYKSGESILFICLFWLVISITKTMLDL